MEKNTIIITIKNTDKKFEEDIEVPTTITPNELLNGLNSAYNLKIDTNEVLNCYLKSENPIALLKGNKTLKEFGLHDGTIILIDDTKEA